MFAPVGKLLKDRRGATAVEYGLILALVVIVLLVGLSNLAGETTRVWNYVARRVIDA